MQSHGSRMGRWFWIASAVLVVWIVFLIVWGPRNRSGSLPSGQRAEYGWTLEQIDGTKVSFDQFRGRPVFLNMWATWCGPCVAEMPSIGRLAAHPRVKDVAFVCVSVDDDWEPVRRFLSERKLDVTILRPTGPIPKVFETDAIPATFLIAANGKVMKAEQGAMEWDRPENVAEVERLLATGPARD